LKHADATKELEASELATLQKQAFGSVEQFEVLKATDVEMLSRVSSVDQMHLIMID
jgi:hypothetical protein